MTIFYKRKVRPASFQLSIANFDIDKSIVKEAKCDFTEIGNYACIGCTAKDHMFTLCLQFQCLMQYLLFYLY